MQIAIHRRQQHGLGAKAQQHKLTFLVHVRITSSTPHAGSALAHGATQPTIDVHAVNVTRVI
jgi:hypothetical protein